MDLDRGGAPQRPSRTRAPYTPSGDRGLRAPAPHRHNEGAGRPPDALTPATPVRARYPSEAPLVIRFEDQSDAAYLVRDIRTHHVVRVPKQRDRVDPYPPDRRRRKADARLLHWSGLALLSVVLGGLPAIVFGLLIMGLAALLLVRHHSRVRAWRRAQRVASRVAALPAAASAEGARLHTALWQGLLAAVLGVLFLLVLLNRLP